MSKDNIIQLIQPGNVEDQLTEILRHGARAVLAQAVEAEVADFLGKHADLKTADGHDDRRHEAIGHRQISGGGALANASLKPEVEFVERHRHLRHRRVLCRRGLRTPLRAHAAA